MTFTTVKYRGTTTYFLVFTELVRAAQQRTTITYGDVAALMGLPPSGHHMAAETGHVLGEISADEAASKRPMLSALAVSIKGMPGPGFFKLARQLGILHADDTRAEAAFWVEQVRALYETWQRPAAAPVPQRAP